MKTKTTMQAKAAALLARKPAPKVERSGLHRDLRVVAGRNGEVSLVGRTDPRRGPLTQLNMTRGQARRLVAELAQLVD